MKPISNNLLLIVLLLVNSAVIAQGTGEKNAGLSTEQVNVVQEYKPAISDAYKLNEQPDLRDTVIPPPSLSYTVNPPRYNTRFIPDTIKPAKLKGEALTRYYPFMMKAGLGNYNTTYGELWGGSLRARNWQASGHGLHRASGFVSEGNGRANFSEQLAEAQGKYFLPEHTLQAAFSYQRQAVRYYGYPARLFEQTYDSLNTRQRFHTIQADAQWSSRLKDSTAFGYRARAHFRNTRDAQASAENRFLLELQGYKKIDRETYGGSLSIDRYSYTPFRDSTGLVRQRANILLANPWVRIGNSRWNATLGLNFFAELEAGLAHFYPNLRANVVVVRDVLSLYAALEGRTQRNSFYVLSQQNPFLFSNADLRNSNIPLEALLGLKGSLGKRFGFDVSGAYSIGQQQAFFVNRLEFADAPNPASVPGNQPYSHRFAVVYDDVQEIRAQGKIHYQLLDQLKVQAEMVYRHFTMATESRAWYRPNWEGRVSGTYCFDNRLDATLSLLYIGPQWARFDYPAGMPGYNPVQPYSEYRLKGIVDAGLELNYHYTQKLGAYITAQNMAGTRYQRWLQYPTMGFNFLAGIRMKF